MKTRVFMVLVGLVVSQGANAARYSVVMPVEASGLECRARAARVSVLFQSVPGVERVDSVDCVNEFAQDSSRGEYRVYTLAIDYQAKRSVELASAQYGLDVNGFGSGAVYGAFANLESCLNARAIESSVFEIQTGASALFLSCLPDEGITSDAFVLSIQGFGKAKKQLISTQMSLFLGRGETLSSSQIQWLGAEFESRGANVRINDGSRLLYYAEYEIPTGLDILASFRSAQECKQQIAEATEIYRKGSSKALVQCDEKERSTEMVALQVGGRINRPSALSQMYDSFESCMKFKPTVASREQRNDPDHFLGLVCAPDILNGRFVHLKFVSW